MLKIAFSVNDSSKDKISPGGNMDYLKGVPPLWPQKRDYEEILVSRTDSALSRLKPDEICIIVMQDGSKRDGAWSPRDNGFHFCDGKGEGFIHHKDVYEWWPASVKF